MKKAAERSAVISDTRRVVLKVGSAVIAGGHPSGLDDRVFANLACSVHALKVLGKEVILVTSGAIAVGMKKMGLKERPKSIPERQAVAALGQSSLMGLYEGSFSLSGEKVAQVLLTHDDLADRRRFLNARNTLMTLLSLGVVPVVNENDTVAIDELKFGDNDNLAALVTNVIEADLLVILTDIDGIYDHDPKRDTTARFIPTVDDVDHLTVDWDGERDSRYGTGGVHSKVEAARTAAHFGVSTIVANGMVNGTIERIFRGEAVGTFFQPVQDRLTSKKHWIAFSARPTGRIFVDDGAMAALIDGGKSLLASGITGIDGRFDTGEVVHCVNSDGKEFARGISGYSSYELDKIKGKKTSEIEEVLGYKYSDEIINRDNLVII